MVDLRKKKKKKKKKNAYPSNRFGGLNRLGNAKRTILPLPISKAAPKSGVNDLLGCEYMVNIHGGRVCCLLFHSLYLHQTTTTEGVFFFFLVLLPPPSNTTANPPTPAPSLPPTISRWLLSPIGSQEERERENSTSFYSLLVFLLLLQFFPMCISLKKRLLSWRAHGSRIHFKLLKHWSSLRTYPPVGYYLYGIDFFFFFFFF